NRRRHHGSLRLARNCCPAEAAPCGRLEVWPWHDMHVARAGTVTMFALLTELRPDPWYHPRYALPLLGMMLGNTMTGIGLGLDVLTNSVVRERAAVEACLALGSTQHQALLPIIRDSLRSGFMPIMNSMAAIGLVSLPGMMTGQILAGVEPVD